jgi:hypothetical protein
VDFSSDRLVERLHRLLLVLEDERTLVGDELPPLAVYDIAQKRWLLAAGVSLETLKKVEPGNAGSSAQFLIIIGSTTVPVESGDPTVLLKRLVEFARASPRAAQAAIVSNSSVNARVR